MARPTSFKQTIADKLCERIAGSESLKSICLDEDMPSESTVRNWLAKGARDEEPFNLFLRQYASAREAQADTDADEIGDIGRKTLEGEYDPQAARVAIDALKWSAGKRAPKKYGDKLDLTSTDGSMSPKPTVIEFVSPDQGDD